MWELHPFDAPLHLRTVSSLHRSTTFRLPLSSWHIASITFSQCSCLGPVIMSLFSEKMIHQACPLIDLQGANFTSNNHIIMTAYESWINLRIWEFDMLPSSTCIALGKRKRPCLKSKQVLLGFSGTTPLRKSTKLSVREQISCNWSLRMYLGRTWKLKTEAKSHWKRDEEHGIMRVTAPSWAARRKDCI